MSEIQRIFGRIFFKIIDLTFVAWEFKILSLQYTLRNLTWVNPSFVNLTWLIYR